MRGRAILMPQDVAAALELGSALAAAWIVDQPAGSAAGSTREQRESLLAHLCEAGIAGRVSNANPSGRARTKD